MQVGGRVCLVVLNRIETHDENSGQCTLRLRKSIILYCIQTRPFSSRSLEKYTIILHRVSPLDRGTMYTHTRLPL